MYRTPVCCTAYTSPNDLWLQIRWDGGQELKALMISATKWAATAQSRNVTVDFNSLRSNKDWILARPNGWNLWFRGKLLGLLDDKNWLVQLVDFGNRLSLPERSDRLLPMPGQFSEQTLPSCAVPCRLARISQRNDWSNRDAKLLGELLIMATEDRILDAEFDWEKSSTGAPVPVELYQRGSELSINDAFGQRTGSLVAKLRGNFLPAISGLLPPPPPKQQHPVNDEDYWDKPFDGLVCHVTDQGIVFVQKDEKRLTGLQSQLELFYDSENLHRFSASSLPNKDEIFAVFQEPPLCHYRGRVLELLGGQRVKLLIVDFGFELIVDWNQCVRLPTNIRYKPQCCPFLPLSLAKSDSPGTKGLSLTSLWTGINKNSTPVRVTVNPTDLPDSDPTEVQTAKIEVHLSDGVRKDIMDFLLNTKEDSTKANQKRIADSKIANYRECREELDWDVDNIVCGTCTHAAIGPTEQSLFFQPNSMKFASDQLKLILDNVSVDKLVKFDASSSKQLPAPVLIQSDDNTAFQRGTVNKFNETAPTACDVTYVDTGKRQQSIPVGRLYKLPDELLTMPTICVKCQLADNTGSAADVARQVRAGEVKIFTIVGVADGAYKIDIVKAGK